MAVLTVTMCSAQVVSLSQAEYFWDTDPGEGAGTALTAADGNFNSAFENIAATGLGAPSVGLHKFSVRIKDNTGAWSPAFVNVVKVEATTTPTPVSLAQAEYFWDTDPGEGNGTALSAADASFDSAFEKIAVSGITMAAVGMHTLNIRIKDNQEFGVRPLQMLLLWKPLQLQYRSASPRPNASGIQIREKGTPHQ
ncbi:MAG: hypothetical protein M0D53_06120 [Flavobacterium sp. JAD_PAG50586_2]|nr:MAG: hypothetical protein M0D53_06120 [Flavobacterium sp. JAD_PAG50586_2]